MTGQMSLKVPVQRRRTCNVWMDKAGEGRNPRIVLAKVNLQSVRLKMQRNMLSINAECKERHECEDVDYLGSEVSCGTLD